MTTLNKKQMTIIYKVIKTSPQRYKKILFSEINDCLYAVATNGYEIHCIKLKTEDKNILNKCINFEEVEKWVKLSSSKNIFTIEENASEIKEEEKNNSIEKLFSRNKYESTDIISFNSVYLKNAQDLNNGVPVVLKFNGRLGPMEYCNKDSSIFGLICPIRFEEV